MTETRTLDRVKAAHLSAELQEQLGLQPDEVVRLTVEPVERPQRNWLLAVYGSWQGPETAEELIELVYSTRTQSTPNVDWETP